MTGDIEESSTCLLLYARDPRPLSREDMIGTRRARATELTHERGGIAKAAMALVSSAPSPRNKATMSILRSKHLWMDHHEIRDTREKMAEIARRPQLPEEPRVAQVERPFDPEDIS